MRFHFPCGFRQTRVVKPKLADETAAVERTNALVASIRRSGKVTPIQQVRALRAARARLDG